MRGTVRNARGSGVNTASERLLAEPVSSFAARRVFLALSAETLTTRSTCSAGPSAHGTHVCEAENDRQGAIHRT